jgi:alpha,alpha-trehalose-phosphate synthase [UDP-forming]
MHSFRLRLILALIAGVTLVSIASTYFEVLTHKHALRQELERRSLWMGAAIQPEITRALAAGDLQGLPQLTDQSRGQIGALGVGVYDPEGKLVASNGVPGVFEALDHPTFKSLAKTPVQSLARTNVEKAIKRGSQVNAFGSTDGVQWLEQVFPLHDGNRLVGAMVILIDTSYIRDANRDLWKGSFWRIVAFVVLIVGVTYLMVRWFLLRPLLRVAERMRRLRMGHTEKELEGGGKEFGLFSPLTREVETMAESLIAARAAAATEARLRDAGEHSWTPERLAVHMHNKGSNGRIFVVSNREPYMHVRKGRETVCIVPPSGLVTAIEPVLRACDGVWVASGSGNADAQNVDQFDRLRVPPDDPRYTLRRVWLSAEEESRYYDGFANEGLWPLCHIAHTRPIFRALDWEAYRLVNEKFASAVLDEMKGSTDPLVFVQDYHFALLPALVKAARPDARVAIFWHIPWPNPEAFGICPWQAQLLDGLLGADLIGFHIPLHCNNFLSTVDRVLESRTDREHMTARRHGHTTLVRPYPVSVAFDGTMPVSLRPMVAEGDMAAERRELLAEFGTTAENIGVGVDRLDYTKGILERLLAVEQLIEQHPWYWERFTMVQIAAPSRTRIPSYADLKRHVEEEVRRINQRFQTSRWKPIVLIDRHCNHEEVTRWYRAADVCLVTSLHDGMNLVAKEFVASRDDEDGVLVLSKFTGAAVELRDALIVNPYDIAAVGEAIHRGLDMPRAERKERMQQMRRQVMEHNIYRWAAMVLGDLREVRLEKQEGMEAYAPGPSSVREPSGVHRRMA